MKKNLLKWLFFPVSYFDNFGFEYSYGCTWKSLAPKNKVTGQKKEKKIGKVVALSHSHKKSLSTKIIVCFWKVRVILNRVASGDYGGSIEPHLVALQL